MASDSLTEVREAAQKARQLGAALDVIEAELSRLEVGARPAIVARALAEPIRAFDVAAKEALR
jgi:hypothetical protein